MERNKKGQAALEFLLTYSWAILVVIVIIGALAYFGVLNPENFIPEKCTFTAGFACDDYVHDGENLTIRIVNGIGSGIQIHGMTVESQQLLVGATCIATNSTGGVIGPLAANNLNLANGQSAEITFTNCRPQGGINKLRADIEVTYRISGGIAQDRFIRGEVFVNTQ